jgi:hypothetical protein
MLVGRFKFWFPRKTGKWMKFIYFFQFLLNDKFISNKCGFADVG